MRRSARVHGDPAGATCVFAFHSRRPLTAAYFGASGEVFFAAQENGKTFAYRGNESGGDLRKVISDPILSLHGVSPNGKYLAVWREFIGEAANPVLLYPADGTPPTIICQNCGSRVTSPQQVSWSPDGKLLYLAAMGGQVVFSIPLHGGEIVPRLPPAGLRSYEETAALPGAKQLPEPFAVASPKGPLYVYPTFSAHRNIYRVPVP